MLNQAIINLLVIRKNALAIRKALPKGVEFCAVVKADAYGHGAVAVSNCIYDIVDSFAVATVEEGVELRLGGIRRDILVLAPIEDCEAERAVRYGLSLTVINKAQVRAIEKEALRQNTEIKLHIKFNTGMNRFGVDSLEEVENLYGYISKRRGVKVEGVFSHYANPNCKKSLKSATDKFLLAFNRLKGYNKNIKFHISASGGFLHGQYFDMVRIGLLLYGYTPFPCDFKVKPAMKVVSSVIAYKSVERGDRVLYGDYKVNKRTTYALIRYGYADGLFRAKIKGQVNYRCMDTTAVKVKRKNKGAITVMDNAVILSKKYKTIPYEVLIKSTYSAEKIYIR